MSNVIDTTTPRDQAVREIVASLEAMIREQLPGFTHIPTTRRRRIASAGAVSDEFLESVAVAIESAPNMGAPNELTPAEVRETIFRTGTFSSLADQLELAARGVRETIAEQRADIGRRALSTYSVVKSVTRVGGPAQNLQSLRRALGRARRKKAPLPPPAEGGAVTK